MNTFDKIAFKIVKEQELAIGSVAWQQASNVKGLVFNDDHTEILIGELENKQNVINNLVASYEILFGKAARQVCIEAVKSLVAELPLDDVPTTLQH